ncbi:two-component system response regulator VicR/two-component system response regulator ResD [Hydrogenispora ethanolica]|uniref:Two-component system response regulator VicR/two-component system response regulator ResD n=1 Tax=Hydrogenispora ethanolica TaxID=1082276 RepID=A0A4R1QSP5_HYDET|nr:response regulator transcription factor [Hydrogenispora ethanolica]TCL56507.1 two-component system response regulator VicR/two-component system response regulator ResD [Hydrogenispora ethanolica]
MSSILIVEDEKNISALLRTHLEREGHQCFQAYDGLEAMEQFQRTHPDLIVLDLMLPGKNGLEICREIRCRSDVYILMLTAKQEEVDKLVGLEMGADDYVTKPFSVRELLARVRVLLRRPHLTREEERVPSISVGELEIDPGAMAVKLNGRLIPLTSLEFDVLYFLMKNRGLSFKREQLLERIWGEDSYVYDRSIDRIISRLRRKIETDPANPQRIVTIWGVGYRFNENS